MSRTFKTTKASAQTLSQFHSSIRRNSEDARLRQLGPQAPGCARSGKVLSSAQFPEARTIQETCVPRCAD